MALYGWIYSDKENYADTQQSIHVYTPLIDNINTATLTTQTTITNNQAPLSGIQLCQQTD